MWFLYLGNPRVPVPTVPGQPDFGRYASELTCTFDGRDPRKRRRCPAIMKRAKARFVRDAARVRETPYQYMNTPSCDKTGAHWSRR